MKTLVCSAEFTGIVCFNVHDDYIYVIIMYRNKCVSGGNKYNLTNLLKLRSTLSQKPHTKISRISITV